MTSNNDQYSGSSKPVERQLSMRLLCRFIASIWILYTARTKLVLFWRLAHLLCRYFASNDNHYWTSSKRVERQLSLRFLCRMIASIWILFTDSTKPVLCQNLAWLTWRYLTNNNDQYTLIEMNEWYNHIYDWINYIFLLIQIQQCRMCVLAIQLCLNEYEWSNYPWQVKYSYSI